MKKLIKLVMVVVAVAIIGVAAKVTVSANEKQVEVAENNTTSNNEVSNENNEGNGTDTQGQNEDGTFTYHYVFVKMEYLTYCKGNNEPHTLVYSVNGGEKVTDLLELDAEDIRSGIPHYMIYYYDFPNVKVGDKIDYEYSYMYRYGGFPEERVIPGSFVVEEPTEEPSEE